MKRSHIIKDASVAALIPAYNEQSVIANTLEAVLKLVPAKDIYVVDDGSRDKTATIARNYTKNVLSTENRGKANALNLGIKYFRLTQKYQFIFFMDADSQPKFDFLEKALIHFKKDPQKKIICVVGRVKGVINTSWVSKYRQWEYQVSYFIHKRAQSYLQSILVAPGCATVYRSNVFEKMVIPKGTMTEDMDFTFQMHRAGYHEMVLEKDAIVYTQDPQNIKDFTKQLNRWYTGFWQVVRKHDIPWRGQMLDLEACVLALEGLYNGLIVIFLFASFLPLSFLRRLGIFTYPVLFDLFIFFIPTLIWSAISDRDPSRILFIFHFYFLRFLSSLIFLKSFFNGFLSLEKDYVWDSNRYLEKKL